MQKGYKAFLQNADTVSYREEELTDLIDKINEIKPYAYSISDTYGTMHLEDVRRLFAIIDKMLDCDILFGFHTHNNLLMANANAQEFLCCCLASGRNGFIDASVWGCGIGAGNAKTELAITYMNKMCGTNYDLVPILEIIDEVIPDIEKRCSWGYNVPALLSGLTGAVITHAAFLVNNYKHLSSEDILEIINTMSATERTIHDLEITERNYIAFGEERLRYLSSSRDRGEYRKVKRGLQKAELRKRAKKLKALHPTFFNLLRMFHRMVSS